MKNNEELQIGKEAICVNNAHNERYLTVGKKYIVHGFMYGCEHCKTLLLVEDDIFCPVIIAGCKHCDATAINQNGKSWYDASRFRSLNAMDALMDKLESEPQQVEEPLTVT